MAKIIEPRSDELFVIGSLDSLLPRDSDCRLILAYLTKLDFNVIFSKYKNDMTGRPSYDPYRLMAIWMRGLMRKVSSAPELARLCKSDIEFRWLCGDNPPEKSILSDFRIKNFEEILSISSQIELGLKEKGLKPARGMVTDGTILLAAGSKNKIRDKKKLQSKLEKIKSEMRELLSSGDKNEVDKKDKERLEQQINEIEELLKYCEAKGLEKVCISEPTAHVMKRKDGSYGPSYNLQLCDDDETGSVLHHELIEQGNDQGRLLQNFENAKKKHPQIGRASGDTAFHKGEDLAKLHEKGIHTSVPNDKQESWKAAGIDEDYQAEKFIKEKNGYRCPEGHLLDKKEKKDKKTYRYYGAPCHKCSKKNKCMSKGNSIRGRSINETIYINDIELTKIQTKSELGKKQLKARSIFSEGISMRLKNLLGIHRLKTWGWRHATIEISFYLMMTEFFVLCGIWKPLGRISYEML
jgi:transposase